MRLSTGSTFEETPWMSSAKMPPSFPGWSEWVVFGVMAPVTSTGCRRTQLRST